MMLEQKTVEFLEALSSGAPVPGGGGASAAVGAFSCALGMMVTNLTAGKKKYADVEDEIIKIRSQLDILKKELVSLVDKDAEAFAPLAKAYSMPKGTREEMEEKEKVMEAALYDASIVPLEIMEKVLLALGHLRVLEEKGSRLAVSDVGAAVLFGRAALEGASLNVYINTKMMKDRERAECLNGRADSMIVQARRLEEEIYAGVLEKIR